MTHNIDPRIPMKNPWTAAVLAFLIPGLGHLYQGRWFKGIIFSVCILGTFYSGVSLGEGRTVYTHYYTEPPNPRFNRVASLNYGYISQVLVGLPALPAMYQTSRYKKQSLFDEVEFPEGTPDMPFNGKLKVHKGERIPTFYNANGIIKFDQKLDDVTFEGMIEGKEEAVQLKLDTDLQPMGGEIYARPRWSVYAEVESGYEEEGLNAAELIGDGYDRSFMNWYQVPLEDETLQELNGRLGKQWDMAMVFTWVAGLLNILAIWDALEGPAYGYGDEPTNKKEDPQPA